MKSFAAMLGRKIRRGRTPGWALLAPLVAFALLAAPTVRAMQSACDQCPPTCPMHAASKPKKSKPSCHNQGSFRPRHDAQHQDESGEPRLSRPPCGHTGTVPGVAMGPMILVNGIAIRAHLPAGLHRTSGELAHLRFDDPPNPRPPIVVS